MLRLSASNERPLSKILDKIDIKLGKFSRALEKWDIEKPKIDHATIDKNLLQAIEGSAASREKPFLMNRKLKGKEISHRFALLSILSGGEVGGRRWANECIKSTAEAENQSWIWLMLRCEIWLNTTNNRTKRLMYMIPRSWQLHRIVHKWFPVCTPISQNIINIRIKGTRTRGVCVCAVTDRPLHQNEFA